MLYLPAKAPSMSSTLSLDFSSAYCVLLENHLKILQFHFVFYYAKSRLDPMQFWLHIVAVLDGATGQSFHVFYL